MAKKRRVGRPRGSVKRKTKLQRVFGKKDIYSKKKTKQRQMSSRKVLGALGVTEGGGQSGPGRPRGTYKHGMPIHVYKQLLRDKALKQQAYQQQKLQSLQQRGISPEQFQQMQMRRTSQQPQQFEKQVQKQLPDDGGYRETPEQIRSQVDDELAFKKWAKERTISPTTRKILVHLMRTQNKPQMEDVEMQRRIMERKMISEQSNLMRSRNLFGPDSNKMDLLGMEGNILTAENVFKSREDNKIMRTNRPSILDTKSAGNNLLSPKTPEEEMRRKMDELRKRRRLR